MVHTFMNVATHAAGFSLPPSLLYNNLSFVDELKTFVYASKKDCVIRKVNESTARVLPIVCGDQEMILHCTATHAPQGLLHSANALLIFFTTASSSQLWSTTSRLGEISHNEADGSGCCGAIVSSPDGVVRMAAGTSKGVVIFAECGATPEAPFHLLSSVKGHLEHAVTAAVLSPFHDSHLFAVTGDSVGRVMCWTRERQPHITLETLECVTALQIIKAGAVVVVANGAGKLHFFDSQTGEILVEVCAHSRWIYALAFHPETNQLISAAEDCYVCVWSVGEQTADGFLPLELFAIHNVPHFLPAGVAFIKSKNHVLLATYDNDVLTEFAIV